MNIELPAGIIFRPCLWPWLSSLCNLVCPLPTRSNPHHIKSGITRKASPKIPFWTSNNNEKCAGKIISQIINTSFTAPDKQVFFSFPSYFVSIIVWLNNKFFSFCLIVDWGFISSSSIFGAIWILSSFGVWALECACLCVRVCVQCNVTMRTGIFSVICWRYLGVSNVRVSVFLWCVRWFIDDDQLPMTRH